MTIRESHMGVECAECICPAWCYAVDPNDAATQCARASVKHHKIVENRYPGMRGPPV